MVGKPVCARSMARSCCERGVGLHGGVAVLSGLRSSCTRVTPALGRAGEPRVVRFLRERKRRAESAPTRIFLRGERERFFRRVTSVSPHMRTRGSDIDKTSIHTLDNTAASQTRPVLSGAEASNNPARAPLSLSPRRGPGHSPSGPQRVCERPPLVARPFRGLVRK